MRKILIGLMITLALLLSFASAEGNRLVVFEDSSYTVYVGKPQTVAVSVENIGEDAPARTVLVWKSSDESVAKVDNRGKVTGVSAGKVWITAAAQDDESVQASVEVEIRTPVKTVAIEPKTVELYIGGTEEQAKTHLTCSVMPEDAYDKGMVWSSSDEEVAAVDQNGAVTALKKGNTVITAVSTDPTGSKKATCKVSVKQAVTGLETEHEEYTVPASKTIQIRTTVSPADAHNKKLIWSSSDEGVATVSDRGVVTGISEGEAVISIVSADGGRVTVSCRVKVVMPVATITVNEGKKLILPAGENKRVTAVVKPDDATVKGIVWSSSDERVATVDQTGMVTAVRNGTAKITAASTDGSNVNGTVTVSVESYDFVFRSGASERIDLYTSSFGGDNIKVRTENQTVSVTVSGVSVMVGSGGVQNTTTFTITPVKAGTDVITFRYGSSSVKKKVYVTPEAVGRTPDNAEKTEDEIIAENNTGTPDEVLFLGIPWGLSCPEARVLLREQGKELKAPVQTNNYLRAMIDHDIAFADVSAYKAAMNFAYDRDDPDFENRNEFYKGDFYFDNKFSFEEVSRAIMSVYGLDGGEPAGDGWTWQKNGVQLTLTQKKKYMILEITEGIPATEPEVS